VIERPEHIAPFEVVDFAYPSGTTAAVTRENEGRPLKVAANHPLPNRRFPMGEDLSNRDMLDWFSEDERNVCTSCGNRARVSLPRVAAHFCLACGAVTIAGFRLDVNHEIRV
jgi:predicted RNA-binding Zn-ribbon protein involved in translation (DUF1610 family)